MLKEGRLDDEEVLVMLAVDGVFLLCIFFLLYGQIAILLRAVVARLLAVYNHEVYCSVEPRQVALSSCRSKDPMNSGGLSVGVTFKGDHAVKQNNERRRGRVGEEQCYV